ALAWRCASGHAAGRTRCEERAARSGGETAGRVPLQGLRHDGDDRPWISCRRSLRCEAERLRGVAVLDLPAHLLVNRLPQPHRRHGRVGVCLPDVSAPRAADYWGGVGGLRVTTRTPLTS